MDESSSGKPEEPRPQVSMAKPTPPSGPGGVRPAAWPLAGTESPDVRASDADRDRVADILREALAEGRLDPTEHAERIDGVYSAKTLGQLEVFVGDLPRQRPVPPPAAAPRAAPHSRPGSLGENLVAVLSHSSRRGRWRVGGRTSAFALFGSVEVDLTEALFEQQEVVVSATAVFGSVEIRVAENVSLRGAGTGIIGSFDVRTVEVPDARAPVVVVTGLALFGSVEARPRRGKWLRDLLDRNRRRRRPEG